MQVNRIMLALAFYLICCSRSGNRSTTYIIFLHVYGGNKVKKLVNISVVALHEVYTGFKNDQHYGVVFEAVLHLYLLSNVVLIVELQAVNLYFNRLKCRYENVNIIIIYKR